MKKVNLEEILDIIIDSKFQNVPREHKTDFQRKLKQSEPYITCILAMKEACRQTLELTYKNANIE